MTASSTIRIAQADDYEQWKTLWRDYNEFYGRTGQTALSDEIVDSTWQRFFDSSESVHCLVAQDDRRLVGLAHFIFHRNTITIEPTCYLQDLFTNPKTRGKGVARSLISEVYNFAEKAGTKGVYWHTHITNKTAMKLYDSMASNTEFVVYRRSF